MICFHFHRPLHGQLHQEESSWFSEWVQEQIHQPHRERAVRWLHPKRRQDHEEARPRAPLCVSWMCAGKRQHYKKKREKFMCRLFCCVFFTAFVFLFPQRKDYSELTQFLPPKYEYVLAVRVSPLQCKIYRHYLDLITRKYLRFLYTVSIQFLYT